MDPNLNEIATYWADVHMARDGSPEAARAARGALIDRYEPAIRRYLLGALRDPDAAADVFQDFACRLLDGAFRNADPSRGRFRDLLRVSLARMVVDYHRARPRTSPAEIADQPIADPRHPELDDEKRFLEIWLADLMRRAWDRLANVEDQSQKPLHAILTLRVEQPDLDSAGLATALQRQTGREVSAPKARKLLHAARRQFISGFVDEVALTLGNPTDEDLEDEIQSLGMLERCRECLQLRRVRKQAGQAS